MYINSYYNLYANAQHNVSRHIRRSGFETPEQAEEYAKGDAYVMQHGGEVVRVTIDHEVVCTVKATGE